MINGPGEMDSISPRPQSHGPMHKWGCSGKKQSFPNRSPRVSSPASASRRCPVQDRGDSLNPLSRPRSTNGVSFVNVSTVAFAALLLCTAPNANCCWRASGVWPAVCAHAFARILSPLWCMQLIFVGRRASSTSSASTSPCPAISHLLPPSSLSPIFLPTPTPLQAMDYYPSNPSSC